MSGDTLPAVVASTASVSLETRQLGLLEQQAAMIARSSLAPPALRGKPDDVMLVGMTGRDLGLGLPTSLQQIDVISGRPVLSARLCGAKATQSGAVWWFEESSSTSCTVAGHRRGQPTRVQRITWTLEDAKRAKLAGKDVWQQHPAAMLRARAVKAWVMAVCPEALLGLDMSATPAEESIDDFVEADEVAVIVAPPAIGPDPWVRAWVDLCREHGLTSEDSATILESVHPGCAKAAALPAPLRGRARIALDEWVLRPDPEPDPGAPFLDAEEVDA